MFCYKCGSKLRSGSKFCDKCGALVGDAKKEKDVSSGEAENKFMLILKSIKKFFVMLFGKIKKIFIASSVAVRLIIILTIPVLLVIIFLVSKIDLNKANELIENIKSSVVSVGVKDDDLGNIVNGQYYFDDGTNQFYSTYDTSGNPHIYSTNKRTGITETIFDGFGWSFAVHDGWLYFSGNSGTSIDATYTLFRIRTDGSNLEHINYSYCVNMNFYKQWLYYSMKSDYYADVSSVYRSSLDGTNEELIVSGVGESALSVVYDNKLYYLDQYGDIYISDPDGTNKLKISNETVYYFVIGAGRIIYLDSYYNIKSTKLDGSDIKTIRVTDGTEISKINSYEDTISYIIYNPTFDNTNYVYSYSINTIKMDGSNDKKVYDGLSWGFYVNLLNDKIYVLDYAYDSYFGKMVAITKNMNFDGTNVQEIYR